MIKNDCCALARFVKTAGMKKGFELHFLREYMLLHPLVAAAAFRTSSRDALLFSTLLPSSAAGGEVLLAEAERFEGL